MLHLQSQANLPAALEAAQRATGSTGFGFTWTRVAGCISASAACRRQAALEKGVQLSPRNPAASSGVSSSARKTKSTRPRARSKRNGVDGALGNAARPGAALFGG